MPFPNLNVGRSIFTQGKLGLRSSFSMATGMPQSEWGLPWGTVDRWCLTGYKFTTGSLRADPSNLPSQEFLYIPPSPIHWDFSNPSRRPNDTEHHNRELKIREQKARYDFHSSHLLGASVMDETILREGEKTFHSRLCFPR